MREHYSDLEDISFIVATLHHSYEVLDVQGETGTEI